MTGLLVNEKVREEELRSDRKFRIESKSGTAFAPFSIINYVKVIVGLICPQSLIDFEQIECFTRYCNFRIESKSGDLYLYAFSHILHLCGHSAEMSRDVLQYLFGLVVSGETRSSPSSQAVFSNSRSLRAKITRPLIYLPISSYSSPVFSVSARWGVAAPPTPTAETNFLKVDTEIWNYSSVSTSAFR